MKVKLRQEDLENEYIVGETTREQDDAWLNEIRRQRKDFQGNDEIRYDAIMKKRRDTK